MIREGLVCGRFGKWRPRADSSRRVAPFVGAAADTTGGLLRGIKAFLTGTIPQGSGVQKRSGGIKGRFELFADLLEENIIAPIAKPMADAIIAPLKDALNIAAGVKPGGDGGLFQVDKNKKANPLKAIHRGGGSSIEGNALGRIGVFTGAATIASLNVSQQQAVAKLDSIHRALVSSGIIIKDAR